MRKKRCVFDCPPRPLLTCPHIIFSRGNIVVKLHDLHFSHTTQHTLLSLSFIVLSFNFKERKKIQIRTHIKLFSRFRLIYLKIIHFEPTNHTHSSNNRNLWRMKTKTCFDRFNGNGRKAHEPQQSWSRKMRMLCERFTWLIGLIIDQHCASLESPRLDI